LKAAIAILCYNGAKHIEDYLPSIIENSPEEVAIYVIDNASTDNSVQVLQQFNDQITVIELDVNYGFAGGYNHGLKQIDADLYFLLNSDVKVPKGWCEVLIRKFQEEKGIGAVQPKVLSLDSPDTFEYSGAAGGYIDRLGYAFCRGRLFDEIEKDTNQYNDDQYVAWGSGCALALDAKLFHSIGGFDERYFAHYEEIDLCWRMRKAGYKILYSASTHIYHLGGGTLQYGNPQKTYLNFRNSLLTLYKNSRPRRRTLKVLLRLLLDGAAALNFLFHGGVRHIWSILRAHFFFYSHYFEIRKQTRHYNQLIAQCRIHAQSDHGVYEGLIVWQHFIKGIKTFKQLSLSDES
jgi:GT2 family glycosyltransferase